MYVCICNGITDQDIRRAAEAGCGSMSELTMRTGAGACCGTCVETASALLEEARPARGPLVELPLVARAA
ncbi:bacterioferritin-associated ferredoxin [Luteimonas composti]|uniref:Bacterioferritin-associated ferredoxin n=1 Tax=Luteimonas composti TaxID=398257 RepID=A0ABT6MT64_9GAMM|nr:bacterioferritin-associated ferredoxin [Luteimonas composti]MDH7453829.1 bacterioferritin-associated ferredoxin [Luteimonas composti]